MRKKCLQALKEAKKRKVDAIILFENTTSGKWGKMATPSSKAYGDYKKLTKSYDKISVRCGEVH